MCVIGDNGTARHGIGAVPAACCMNLAIYIPTSYEKVTFIEPESTDFGHQNGTFCARRIFFECNIN